MASRLNTSRDWRTPAWVAGAVLSLCLSGTMHGPLLQTREIRSPGSAAALRDASPLVAFSSVALGGFRGIVTDMLWLRMLRLQDDGRYFEVLQLSNWITALEPDCVEIWSYQSWNMAYNVTEVMTRDEDRWRWVENALNLLRWQGLRHNPNSPELCWQIGWLFQHKIGAVYDPAHAYYRRQLAERAEQIVGGGILPAGSEPAPELARRMEEAFAMDLRIMREADSLFGTLDWRLPESHALYWALQAKRHTVRNDNPNYDRMLYQNLVDLFLRGTLKFDAQHDVYETSPDLARYPHIAPLFETSIRDYPDAGFEETYGGFLRLAMQQLYDAGRIDEARGAFERVRERFPASLAGASTVEAYMNARKAPVQTP